MSKINEQIERLKELVRKCYATVAGKNGTVPEVGERNMENLPNAIASTHDTLEELTITQNGEYTPQEGVDGFSKVVARVVPTKKVVIPDNMRVTNALIVDGYWAGELVDTSNVINMHYMFNGCSQLQYLDVSNWDTSNVILINNMFESCSQLQYLDVSKWDASKVTSAQNFFFQNNKLNSIVGNRTIDDVLANNIGALNGLKVSLSFWTAQAIDRASLRAVINGLADLTGQTAQTLTLGTTLMAKLTEEDIAIATNKNWTIA